MRAWRTWQKTIKRWSKSRGFYPHFDKIRCSLQFAWRMSVDITTLELTQQLIRCKSVFPDDSGCLDILIPPS